MVFWCIASSSVASKGSTTPRWPDLTGLFHGGLCGASLDAERIVWARRNLWMSLSSVENGGTKSLSASKICAAVGIRKDLFMSCLGENADPKLIMAMAFKRASNANRLDGSMQRFITSSPKTLWMCLGEGSPSPQVEDWSPHLGCGPRFSSSQPIL